MKEETELLKMLVKKDLEREKELEELRRALGRKECVDAVKNLVPTTMAAPAAQAVAVGPAGQP